MNKKKSVLDNDLVVNRIVKDTKLIFGVDIENIILISPLFKKDYKNTYLFYASFIEDGGKKAAFLS